MHCGTRNIWRRVPWGIYAENTCVGNWPPIPLGWGQLLIPKSEWAYLCQGVLHYEYVVPRFGVQVVC